MMTRYQIVVITVGLTLLTSTGCHHKVFVAAVPAIPVPTISVPPPTHKTEPLPSIELEALPMLTLQVPRQPLPRFRPRPTTARQLALLLPPAPRPVTLGELTTGGETLNSELRQETENLLRSQQQRLQAVQPSSASSHLQQFEQARLFLRQAMDAWRKSDIEGAHTLVIKTKVLLDEL